METPRNLQRIIDTAHERGIYRTSIDSIFVPFFQKLIKSEHKDLKLELHYKRNDTTMQSITLKTVKHDKNNTTTPN